MPPGLVLPWGCSPFAPAQGPWVGWGWSQGAAASGMGQGASWGDEAHPKATNFTTQSCHVKWCVIFIIPSIDVILSGSNISCKL